ncbi:MAG: serine protein kinase PrkA [Nanoarchaeota archaeon]|nr:serine protein kinase PrkA [Nanoarchaeota archaeon]MCG2718348.1 serine protein kinase PrkA [Nanoarchaeota archaeon]
MKQNVKTLDEYMGEIKDGKRRFENAFQTITRMILDGDDMIEKVNVNGKQTFDFNIFRQGKKHMVGMYDEINSFVNFVKDAAEGGSSNEMAFILVGEPGNGKTFFVEYLCSLYRNFLELEENKKFTFQFKGLDKLASYGKIDTIESQSYEDPMILAMSMMPTKNESIKFLQEMGFTDEQLEQIYSNYRPLGACSSYILNDLRKFTGGDIEKIKEMIEVVEVPMSETLGTVTGKYPAKDKITSSAVDLLGEESIQRLLHITDTNNPYRFDIRRGALARIAGGGIHFSDELFRNKKDLVQVYLGVIQNRTIEVDGYKWPIDALIIGTSNNSVFNKFLLEEEEAPIVDRCRVCYVGHNTNYKLQNELTRYAIGSKNKKTLMGEVLHEDPNLVYAASLTAVLSRLPRVEEKLTPIEMMKLAAGEQAGEKSIKTLAEVIDRLMYEPDVTKRFGQKGIGQRNLGRAIQKLLETSETNEGKCLYAEDFFKAMGQVILDYVPDSNDRTKYLDDIKIAKSLYRDKIMEEMFNAYMDEPMAIKKDVMNYVNMIIGVGAEHLGPDKVWKYKDPQTAELKAIKIDEKYVNSVEERLGLKSNEQKETFRTTIRKIYGQKVITDPNYDFMDNNQLVKAVTDVRLKSDIAGAGSLIGALANRTNEENQKLYDRMIDTMANKLNYCPTCAQRTIEYFCTKQDEK